MLAGPWSLSPAWQNYSSMFREAIAAVEAPTEMERAHHMTASLYFGIAAIEAFLNQEMRQHLRGKMEEDAILKKLRHEEIMKKAKKWPTEIIGESAKIDPEIIHFLNIFNNIRGNLTHPKTQGPDIYSPLLEHKPTAIIDATARYIVEFHEAQGTRFPYWIFGWNYLNPRPDSHEIILINDQQFTHSQRALGIDINAYDADRSEAWRNHFLGTVTGYQKLKVMLSSMDHCEPKDIRFPHQPKLCRRWWDKDHQKSCGRVSDAAIAAAIALDEQYSATRGPKRTASTRWSGAKWAYLMVIAKLEWPRIFCKVKMLPPFCMKWLAKVCRRE